MSKRTKSAARKKTIAVVVLAVLLLLAVGVIAYQVFYPAQVGPSQTASFASKSDKKSVKSDASSSTASKSSESTTKSTPKESSSPASSTTQSWSGLTDTQKDAVFARWVNNAEGKFDVYTGETNRIYLVNTGSNGVSSYSDPVDVINNTARVQINADGTYDLQVPDATQTGLRTMQNPWPAVNWKTQETGSSTDLFAQYGTAAELSAGQAQLNFVKNTTVPVQ